MKKGIVLASLLLIVFGSAQAKIEIQGKNKQIVEVESSVTNRAESGAKAIQNLSSNKGSVTIKGDNEQRTTVKGTVTNHASGNGAIAEQNLASNSSQ